jgi:hypothetical protein
MNVGEAAAFYLLIGSSVSVSVYLSNARQRCPQRWFRVATALVFWPLYMTILLARPHQVEQAQQECDNRVSDDAAIAIERVQAELEGALANLDEWAEDVLACEKDYVGELGAALEAQAARIREIDRVLAQIDSAGSSVEQFSDTQDARQTPAGCSRWQQSAQAQKRNLERLRRVRERSREDLMGTLAWLRELVSMIHLAKFTGAPVSRAEELVKQIAAAVEGISAVSWQDMADFEVGEGELFDRPDLDRGKIRC